MFFGVIRVCSWGLFSAHGALPRDDFSDPLRRDTDLLGQFAHNELTLMVIVDRCRISGQRTTKMPPTGQLRRIACFASLLLLTACAIRPSLPDPLEAGWRGVPVCEKLHQDSEQRVLRCSFPPGVGHERHYHRRHFGYALAGGRMQITDSQGTRAVDLATGSSFTSHGVAWHEVVNIGDTTVVYLIVEPR